METVEPVRFGFLGAGWIAQRAFAPAVHGARGAVLQAVAARDGERARRLEPIGSVYTDYADLLADPGVDAVYISLTNELHRRWTLAALAAGKHVICEKPLGLDPGEVREMHDAADRAGLVLLEGFFYRWHPRMRRIGELVGAGELGAVRSMDVEFSFDGGGQERMAGNYRLEVARGGGALYDVGVYPLAAAHALLGPVLEVTEASARTGSTGVDVDATAVLVAPSGARVAARCGIEGRTDQHLVLHGAGGTLATGLGETFTSWHAPSSLVVTAPDGQVREEEFGPADPYAAMVEAFADRLLGRGELLVGRADSEAVAGSLQAWRRRATRSAAPLG